MSNSAGLQARGGRLIDGALTSSLAHERETWDGCRSKRHFLCNAGGADTIVGAGWEDFKP